MTPPALLARAWPPLLFVVASLVLNRGLLPHLTDTLPGNAGDPMLNAWILGWVSEAAVTDPWALWNAPIFHPSPNALALSEHLIGIAAFVAPVYWLTQNAVLTYNVAYLLGFAFLGWATFHFVRTITGRTDAAIVAGLAVMGSPYFTSSQVARLQMLSAGWSLLTWSLVWRWAETPRWTTLAGATGCWVLQAYSNTYLGLFLAAPAAVLVVAARWRQPVRLSAAQAGSLGAAVVVAALAVAPVLWHYRAVHADQGLAHSADEVDRYSARVSSYGRVWYERGGWWAWRDEASDRALYPGTPLALLAADGLAASLWRRGPVTSARAAIGLAVIATATAMFTLGPDPAWDGDARIGVPGPYALVERFVPGADGIRAPGRFAIFVMLALGGLAGVGAHAMFAGARRGVRTAGLTACAVAALGAGERDYDWLAHLDSAHPESAAAYAWLAQQSPAPLLEMPVVTHFQAQRPVAGASVTLRYQMAALEHGHRLVNGSSGFTTPLTILLQAYSSPFTTLDTVDDGLHVLRALGTRYVLTHRHEYAPRWRGHADEMLAALRADRAQVERVHDFGSAIVLALRPAEPPAPLVRRVRVPRPEYALAVSHAPDAAARLRDGDVTTAWQAPQEGATWIDVQLRRARVLSGVKLEMATVALPDYPHHLRVVGRGPDGRDVVLFDGPGIVPAALTAVHEPEAPGLRITWTPQPLSGLRLEQPIAAGDRRWVVHELHLLTETALD